MLGSTRELGTINLHFDLSKLELQRLSYRRLCVFTPQLGPNPVYRGEAWSVVTSCVSYSTVGSLRGFGRQYRSCLGRWGEIQST